MRKKKVTDFFFRLSIFFYENGVNFFKNNLLTIDLKIHIKI